MRVIPDGGENGPGRSVGATSRNSHAGNPFTGAGRSLSTTTCDVEPMLRHFTARQP